MPNWIKNRIDFQGKREDIERVFEFLKGEKGLMDFNKVIPMPETYKKYDTTNHYNGIGIEDQELKFQYVRATREQQKKYGVVGWYDWSIKYWGSKWNACGAARVSDSIMFKTAWSGVPTVVKEIAKKFPELYIEYAYADEDAGSNVGTGYSDYGEKKFWFSEEEDNSDEAWRVFFDLWECEDEFEKVDGEWRFKED